MERFTQHFGLAFRSVIRAPGFAVTAALTLALGIGLSTAVFTVANAVLLRRLPVRDQDRVVLLWAETRDGKFANYPLTLSDVRAFQRRSQSLADVAFFGFRGATPAPMRAGDRDQRMQIALVSGNFFDVLGSRPAIGRGLHPDDDRAGAAPVVVLSYRAWRQRFGGDSAVIGRPITMLYTGRASTVIGVMPQGLDYPTGTDVWAPLIAYGTAGGFLDFITGELDLLARLRPGSSPAQARAELTSFLERRDAPAWQRDARGVVHPFADIALGDTKPAVLLITFAAALLLFLACVNVANLLLVRALARAKELAVRTALGASRGRLVVQLLTESGLLALAGGIVGVGLAVAAVRGFVAVAPSNVARLDEIGVNRAALLAAVLITTVAMLVSGLGPALFTSRVDAHEALRSGARRSGGRRVRAAAETLVVAQIALAAVSLTAAGLVARSLVRLQRLDLSFAQSRLFVAELTMQQDKVTDVQRRREEVDDVVSAVEAMPEVQGVTPVLGAPFVGGGGGIDGRLSTPGQGQEEEAGNPMLNLEVAAPNYFAMLGIPLLRGRAFTDRDRDGTASVIIVSSAVARHFWPGSDPIGKQLRMPGRDFTVVGVVPDTRYRELKVPRPTVYFAPRQSPFTMSVPSTLLIRTTGSPAGIAPALRRAVADAHPGATLVSVTSLPTLLDGLRAQPRLNAIVLALFAAAAVSLAAIGLFAIIATMVRQRTQELGIRMALGATAGDVQRMVLGRGLSLALVGAGIGVAGAVATSRLLAALLFEISPTDVATLVAVAGSMIVVAAIASFVPARSSGRVDPIIALRSEG